MMDHESDDSDICIINFEELDYSCPHCSKNLSPHHIFNDKVKYCKKTSAKAEGIANACQFPDINKNISFAALLFAFNVLSNRYNKLVKEYTRKCKQSDIGFKGKKEILSTMGDPSSGGGRKELGIGNRASDFTSAIAGNGEGRTSVQETILGARCENVGLRNHIANAHIDTQLMCNNEGRQSYRNERQYALPNEEQAILRYEEKYAPRNEVQQVYRGEGQLFPVTVKNEEQGLPGKMEQEGNNVLQAETSTTNEIGEDELLHQVLKVLEEVKNLQRVGLTQRSVLTGLTEHLRSKALNSSSVETSKYDVQTDLSLNTPTLCEDDLIRLEGSEYDQYKAPIVRTAFVTSTSRFVPSPSYEEDEETSLMTMKLDNPRAVLPHSTETRNIFHPTQPAFAQSKEDSSSPTVELLNRSGAQIKKPPALSGGSKPDYETTYGSKKDNTRGIKDIHESLQSAPKLESGFEERNYEDVFINYHSDKESGYEGSRGIPRRISHLLPSSWFNKGNTPLPTAVTGNKNVPAQRAVTVPLVLSSSHDDYVVLDRPQRSKSQTTILYPPNSSSSANALPSFSAMQNPPITDSVSTLSGHCPVCNRDLSLSTLEEHETHVRECLDQSTPLNVAIQSDNGKFEIIGTNECQTCGGLFSSQGDLERHSRCHMGNVSTHAVALADRTCPVCYEVFGWAVPYVEFERHVQSHFGTD